MGKKQKKRGSDGRFVRNINTWKIEGDIGYCYLGDELLFFTDSSNVDKLRDYPISKIAQGYSSVRINGHGILVHRFLSQPKKEELVDHINRCKKDNRLSNLRNTNKSVNAFNSKIRTTNSSGVCGVWYRKDTKRWTAEIKYHGKKTCLGCFETKEDAIKARKRAEDELNVYKQ